MAVEIIKSQGRTESGLWPWQTPENQNWYWVRWEDESGSSGEYVKRTAHAAAIGRAMLAEVSARRPGVTAVTVWERDGDADSWPHGVIEDGRLVGMADAPRTSPLAAITDVAEPDRRIRAVEEAMEAAVLAQRIYNAARRNLMNKCVIAEDEGNVSANKLARMVNGVISRPTLLKALSVYEEELTDDEG